MSNPKVRRSLQAAALGLVVVISIAQSGLLSPHPAPRYTVTDLGVLPGYASSQANAINSRGDVAGMLLGTHWQAVVFQNGHIKKISGLPNRLDSSANGINSRGEVTGYARLPTGSHAFLCSGGKVTDLGTLIGFSGSKGTAINDQGEVTGYATGRGVAPGAAFIYSHGKMTNLGNLPGGSASNARSINSVGQIVAESYTRPNRVRLTPFLYDSHRKVMTALPVPPPYIFGQAHHINDHGQVIGNISAPNETFHAVVWNAGRVTILKLLPGRDSARGLGINNQGEAVGATWTTRSALSQFVDDYPIRLKLLRPFAEQSDKTYAFVYQNSEMQDLNTVIPGDSDWELEEATAVNNRGQIVGQGLHHGQERAFLLTPIR